MSYYSFSSHIQLCNYFEEKGEYYVLNIDTDVAVWLDSRAFHKKSPLRKACGFVIVNSKVHDDFDRFKKSHSQ